MVAIATLDPNRVEMRRGGVRRAQRIRLLGVGKRRVDGGEFCIAHLFSRTLNCISEPFGRIHSFWHPYDITYVPYVESGDCRYYFTIIAQQNRVFCKHVCR